MDVKAKGLHPLFFLTVLTFLAIPSTVLPVEGQICNPGNYACLTCTTFQMCISNKPSGPVVTCPASTICSASAGFECSLGECVECSQMGRFADESDPGRYYICIPNPNVPGTFTKIEMTCPDGTQYDPQVQGCAYPVTTTTSAATTTTTENPTTTTAATTTTVTTPATMTTVTSATTPTSVTTPTTTRTTRTTVTSTTTPIPTTTVYPCVLEGRFPDVTNCSNYYMCTSDTLGGFYVYKYTCPTTTQFSPIIRKCVLAGVSGCIPVAG